MRGPENWDLDSCADNCLKDAQCTGFSFDITLKQEPFACILRTGVCQAMAISTRWAYFERAEVGSSDNADDIKTTTPEPRQEQTTTQPDVPFPHLPFLPVMDLTKKKDNVFPIPPVVEFRPRLQIGRAHV